MDSSHLKELRLEITDLLKDEGYTVLETIIEDFGKTIKLVIEKDGQKNLLPVRECFYDTDEDGNRTKVHGVLDIRQTPWYRNRMKERINEL